MGVIYWRLDLGVLWSKKWDFGLGIKLGVPQLKMGVQD